MSQPFLSLTEFLTNTFSGLELHQLVSSLPSAREVLPWLPPYEATPRATMAIVVVEVLHRRGMIDDNFFNVLRRARPQLDEIITQLQSTGRVFVGSPQPVIGPVAAGAQAGWSRRDEDRLERVGRMIELIEEKLQDIEEIVLPMAVPPLDLLSERRKSLRQLEGLLAEQRTLRFRRGDG